jgi:FtsP/CotA-like multicopper oxidase with cupredoxin domain
MHEPIRVEVGRLTRLYVANLTEFDLINSLHLHGMFFDVFRTGTSMTPSESTDTIMLCQGERAILETRFRYPGQFMFHAHQSEFAELGWMGLFEAVEARRDT